MALKVSNITKSYDEKKVVDNISFELSKGEIVGFLGPNGAGKTTTFRMIMGVLKPDLGSITFQGKSIQTHKISLLKKIGYLPEGNPLYPNMYVVEYLKWIGKIYALHDLKIRIEKYLDLLSLENECHKKIHQLSKGYKQRLGLVASLIHEPDLLILDEPTSGLDPNQLVEIRKLIIKIGKSRAILFSSHILGEVQAIANRILLINQGKLVLDTSTENISKKIKKNSILHFKVSEDLKEEDFDNLKPYFTEVTKRNNGEILFTTDSKDELKNQLLKLTLSKKWNVLYLQESNQDLEYIFNQLTKT